jgi:hypothetical protein
MEHAHAHAHTHTHTHTLTPWKLPKSSPKYADRSFTVVIGLQGCSEVGSLASPPTADALAMAFTALATAAEQAADPPGMANTSMRVGQTRTTLCEWRYEPMMV